MGSSESKREVTENKNNKIDEGRSVYDTYFLNDFAVSDLVCGICLEDYDSVGHVPKVIHCGHTLCIKCISNIQTSTKICPYCGASMLTNVNEYPVNYSFLSLVESCKEQEAAARPTMAEEISTLKKRIESCMRIHQNNVQNNDELLTRIDICSINLSDIEKERKEDEFTRKDIEELKKSLSSIESSLENVMPKPRFVPGKLRNPELFLYEVYKSVERGHRVYSAHYVDGQVRFGRVSIWSDLLLFHCLSESEAKDNQFVIKFDDLKKCISSVKLKAFVQIKCNSRGLQRIVIIELLGSSLMPQFVKLCTGELGSSYKGVQFSRGENLEDFVFSIMKVKHYTRHSKKRGHPIDYGFSADETSEKVYFPCDSVVVKASENGEFQIYKNTSKYYYSDVVGKVESPTDMKELISYENPNSLSIKDCGILFSF